MSLHGKILTILNALAAIAFFVIAGMDYSARQAWAFAMFRHELAIHGLPLDDKDDSWRPGTPIVKDLTNDALTKIFASAGGLPVRTQLDAVKQAKATALNHIETAGQAGEAQARQAIAEVWRPLPKLGHERDKLMELVATKPLDELKGFVTAQFDDVIGQIEAWIAFRDKYRDSTDDQRRQLTAQDQGKTPGLAIVQRNIADLLYNFAPNGDPGLRERAQIVVGLRESVAAADRQASNLFAMSLRLDEIMKEDSNIFARQYQELIPQLEVLNEQLKADLARLETQKKIFEQHNVLYQARKTERDELLEKLRQEGEKVATESANLANLQRQLFALQRQIADARATNEKLETQIRNKELGQ